MKRIRVPLGRGLILTGACLGLGSLFFPMLRLDYSRVEELSPYMDYLGLIFPGQTEKTCELTGLTLLDGMLLFHEWRLFLALLLPFVLLLAALVLTVWGGFGGRMAAGLFAALSLAAQCLDQLVLVPKALVFFVEAQLSRLESLNLSRQALESFLSLGGTLLPEPLSKSLDGLCEFLSLWEQGPELIQRMNAAGGALGLILFADGTLLFMAGLMLLIQAGKGQKEAAGEKKAPLQGSLLCLSGELKGLRIGIKEAEKIRIGRDPKRCQLICKAEGIKDLQLCVGFDPGPGAYLLTAFGACAFLEGRIPITPGRELSALPGTVILLDEAGREMILLGGPYREEGDHGK